MSSSEKFVRRCAVLFLVVCVITGSSIRAEEPKPGEPKSEKREQKTDEVKKDEPNPYGPGADKPRESILDNTTGAQKEQISCGQSDCIVVPFDETTDDKIRDLMSQKAGKMMVRLDDKTIGLTDDAFAPMLDLMREISKREGTVIIEPVYIGIRGMEMLPAPVVKDILTATYSIFTRMYNAIKYRNTKNYHAKAIYNPVDRSVLLVYFVHKSYGDICTTLKSNCEDVEYLDDDTFDQMLSQRLKDAATKGRTVRVTFGKTPATLPRAELTMANLTSMDRSTRLYKWFVASSKTEKKKAVRERFIPAIAVASAINYAFSAYDTVKAVIMYMPAREMKAEVVYTGEESGGDIQVVTFSPKSE